MWGAWILLAVCVSLVGCQDQKFDYEDYYDYAADVAIPETNVKTRQPSPSAAPKLTPKPRRPGSVKSNKNKPRGTTPVPIIKDIRRVDPNSGAFYYHYEGGDGSMKHEVRFPNGTVLGNFTYVKKNGELETQSYNHGLGSNIVDNDNGNYDLHRHLEEAYVHQSGPDPVEELFPEDAFLQPNSVRIQSHRPIAQPRPIVQSRPVARPRVRAHPRPIALQQSPSVFRAPEPVPLDLHDSQTAFSFQDESRPIFNPNTVDVAPIEYQAQASSLQPVVKMVPKLSSFSSSQDQLSEHVQDYEDYYVQ